MKTRKNNKGKNNKRNKTEKVLFYKTPPELLNINGINVLMIPNKLSGSLKVQCTMFGGNYLENSQNYGIAHLLEHLLMSSSKHCKKNLCETYLNKYGIKSNASTHDMYTNYWALGLPEYKNEILNFVTSIILDPKITEKILKREKEAVKHELEGVLNNPDTELVNQIYKKFYKPLSYKNSINYKKQLEILKTIDMTKINNYLKKTRVKNCLMFTISGNFNKKEIVEYFKKLKIPTTKEKCKLDTIKNISHCYTFTNKTLYVKNMKSQSTKIMINYPIDIKIGNKYGIYLNFLNKILTSGLSSLLLKRLRLELNLVYGISASYSTNLCGTVLTIETSTDNNNVKKVIREIFRLIDYYIEKMIPKIEIEREKIKYKLNLTKMCKTDPTVLSVFYKHQYFWQLHKKNKKIYTFSDVEKNILSLNQKTLKDLMKKIFDKSKCMIAYSGKKKYSKFF